MPILTPSYAERMARFKGNLVLQGRTAHPHQPLDGTNARTSSNTSYIDSLHGKGDYIRQGPSGPIVEPCCQEDNDMIILVRTTDGERTITLPFTLNEGQQITVSWGDASDSEIYDYTSGPITHTYELADTVYYIRISGTADAFGDSGYLGHNLIISVLQWGNLRLTSLANAFYDASSLIFVPNNVPGTVTNMSRMFRYATIFNGDISEWDVSNVTNMEEMFRNAEAFEGGDLTGWNTGNVTDMRRMFKNAFDLSANLSTWDVGNVTNMYRMFSDTHVFNSDLSLWNTENVTDMQLMFQNSFVFNSDISEWNTAKVTSMQGMFQNAELFNSVLSDWNVGNVTTMYAMFDGATAFQGTDDLTGWNPGKVTTMALMFRNAAAFTGDISTWNVGKVTTMESMFEGATLFNGAVGDWNTAKVTDMNRMFHRAMNFNQSIQYWDTCRVTDMAFMFAGYEVEGTLFYTKFQQYVNTNDGYWDVGRVTTMESMFAINDEFDQELQDWDVSGVTNMASMFDSATNFNGEVGWGSKTGQVQQMQYMFRNAVRFNRDLNDWDVGSVQNMASMFSGATAFNGSVNGWNTSSVTNMNNMFREASNFFGGGAGDPGVNAWNVSSVMDMSGMFINAGSAADPADRFLRDLGAWVATAVTDHNADLMFAGTSMPTNNSPAYIPPALWTGQLNSTQYLFALPP